MTCVGPRAIVCRFAPASMASFGRAASLLTAGPLCNDTGEREGLPAVYAQHLGLSRGALVKQRSHSSGTSRMRRRPPRSGSYFFAAASQR
jgi:hypothetical protein